MNILFVTPPPNLPSRLHRNRSFDLVKILARKHNVHLLCTTTTNKESSEFAEIKRVCKSVTIVRMHPLKAIVSCLLHPLLPSEVAYCISQNTVSMMTSLIRKERIDIVYAKRLRSSVYLEGTEIPVVIDVTDAMSLFYKQMALSGALLKRPFYFLEYIRYCRYEKVISKKWRHWVVCSEEDKMHLASQQSVDDIIIDIVPNPVDTEYFSLQKNRPPFPTLLFRGLMDKPVNIDAVMYFVKEVFPIIRKSIPNAHLQVVGPNPTQDVLSLQDATTTIAGYVKDIRKMYSVSTVAICPVRIGTGSRFKILQAWAMGIPVVSTTKGAEGLPYKANWNIMVADSASAFAKSTILVLQNPALQRRLSINGRRTGQKFGFATIQRKLEHVLIYASKTNTPGQ